jgi:hypothetical protein
LAQPVGDVMKGAPEMMPDRATRLESEPARY